MNTAKQLRKVSKKAVDKRRQEEAVQKLSEQKRIDKMKSRIPELAEDFYLKVSSHMATAAEAGRFSCSYTISHTNQEYYDIALKPATALLSRRLRDEGFKVNRYKGKKKIDGNLNYVYKVEVCWEKSEFKVGEKSDF